MGAGKAGNSTKGSEEILAGNVKFITTNRGVVIFWQSSL